MLDMLGSPFLLLPGAWLAPWLAPDRTISALIGPESASWASPLPSLFFS